MLVVPMMYDLLPPCCEDLRLHPMDVHCWNLPSIELDAPWLAVAREKLRCVASGTAKVTVTRNPAKPDEG